MVSSTRSSARLANQADASPAKTNEQTSPKGTKRKAGQKAAPEKKQKTLEESIPEGDGGIDDGDMIRAGEAVEAGNKTGDDESAKKGQAETESEQRDEKAGAKDEVKEADASNGGAVEQSSQREKQMPSNIVEKGIIYFFVRKRVGIDDAEGPEDLQRSYFVLRPIPHGAKLGDGAIDDTNDNRLFALPKKVLPKSHSDRFMAFVEKAKTSVKDLKENFFAGSEHETKTMGNRVQPPATPIGEGVYAITETGGSSHLAYMLTIPTELGEVQQEMGLNSKGSFVMSVKNPERKGPTYAQLPQGPEFPKEIIEEFRGLAWVHVRPKYLDYANAQILLIGEGTGGDVAHALEPTSKDQKNGSKETPQEELEQLEHEDELRIEHLHGDDTVFDDLKLSHEEYSRVPTTW